MGSSKVERQRILNSGAPQQSLSQRELKNSGDMEKKFFGGTDKAVRSALRREKKQKFWEEQQLLEERREFQIVRALEKVSKKNATPQDMECIDRRGLVVDSYTTSGGTQVTITVVDFYCPNSKNSSCA